MILPANGLIIIDDFGGAIRKIFIFSQIFLIGGEIAA
jgi:hypothetical protein